MNLVFNFTISVWLALNLIMPIESLAKTVDWRLIPDRNSAVVWKVNASGEVSKIKFQGQMPLGGGLDNRSGLHVSPDQTKILYELKNDLWFFDLLTQKHRQLTSVGKTKTNKLASVTARSIAWSFDSKQIIYEVVSGALEPEGGDGPDWKVLPRVADFGVKRFDLSTGVSTRVELKRNEWAWDPAVLLPDDQMLVVAKGTNRMPLNGEIHIFDLKLQASKQLIKDVAWYGIPRLSRNVEWAVIGAGTRINSPEVIDQSSRLDSSEKKAVRVGSVLRDDGLRTQLKKINLKTGESFDVTDVARWAVFNFEDISPSGSKVAYFQRELSHPNDRHGVVAVNGRNIFISSHFAHPYWIDEETLAIVQTNLLKTDEIKIIVLNVELGTVISEFLIPQNKASK